MKWVSFSLSFFLFLAAPAFAAGASSPLETCDTSAPNTGDHVLVNRISGSQLLSQHISGPVQYEVSDKNTALNASDKNSVVSGKLNRSFYCFAPQNGVLPNQIVEAYQKDLAQKGLQPVKEMPIDASMVNDRLQDVGGQLTNHDYYKSLKLYELQFQDAHKLIMMKDADGKKIFASLIIFQYRPASWHDEAWFKRDPAWHDAMLIDMVETGSGDALQMTHVDAPPASVLAETIQEQGKVDVYGIQFDFNKADIKPESKPTLEQIAKLLKDDPALKLNVIGHTDNVGGKEFNDKLSLARAAAVAAALVHDYGIDASRLSPAGKGFSEPKASNDTEEGRAKNRRVELTKRL